MTRGTTPTTVVDLSGFDDLSNIEVIHITFKQKDLVITKDEKNIVLDDVNKKATVTLSQEETLKFEPQEHVLVQMRLRTKNGKSVASNVSRVSVRDILEDGVI